MSYADELNRQVLLEEAMRERVSEGGSQPAWLDLERTRIDAENLLQYIALLQMSGMKVPSTAERLLHLDIPEMCERLAHPASAYYFDGESQ